MGIDDRKGVLDVRYENVEAIYVPLRRFIMGPRYAESKIEVFVLPAW
jgi:hypothetical protein